MALVVFLRGVNVGGHRRFRPSVLAQELKKYDVVNIGAAGTFIVRKPGARAKFEAELRRRLPFACEVIICDGRELIALADDDPFARVPVRADVTRFVTILPKAARVPVPVSFPPEGAWLVRILAVRGRFVCGVYRRHMKTIGYLGQADKLFGAKGTTRNWNTMSAVIKTLDAGR